MAEVLVAEGHHKKMGVPSVLHEVKALLQDVASSDGDGWCLPATIFSDLGGYSAASEYLSAILGEPISSFHVNSTKPAATCGEC